MLRRILYVSLELTRLSGPCKSLGWLSRLKRKHTHPTAPFLSLESRQRIQLGILPYLFFGHACGPLTAYQVCWWRMEGATCTILHPAAMEGLAEKIKKHINDDPTDPRYTKSFGPEIDSLDNKRRWMPAGAALQEWNETLAPQLQELMEDRKMEIQKKEKTVDCHIFRLFYMMGRDQDHAHPTVIIACDGRGHKGILKKTMSIIIRNGKLAQKGFKLRGMRATDLDFKARHQRFYARITSFPDMEGLRGPVSLYGKRIRAENTQKEAVIGGTIIVDDRYYALTVAHPFVGPNYTGSKPRDGSVVEFFDTEWALETDNDDDYDDDDDDDDSYDNDSAYDSDQERQSLVVEDVEIPDSDHSHGLRIQDMNSVMDWAVIELEDDRLFGANELKLNVSRKSVWVYPNLLKSKPFQGEVVIASPDGIFHGVSSGAAAAAKLRHATSDTTVWAVHTQEKLRKCQHLSAMQYADFIYYIRTSLIWT